MWVNGVDDLDFAYNIIPIIMSIIMVIGSALLVVLVGKRSLTEVLKHRREKKACQEYIMPQGYEAYPAPMGGPQPVYYGDGPIQGDENSAYPPAPAPTAGDSVCPVPDEYTPGCESPEPAISCPKCGVMLQGMELVCPRCQANISKRCPVCQKLVSFFAKECPQCGYGPGRN